ncbi:MAG TPA: site-2 protease family protein, partial [Bacilli bacterium]|nr:site-2 protease family protein [Bacilli bacterium]
MENKKEEKKVTEKSGLINIIELIAIIIFIIVVLAMFPNTIIWNIVVLLLILSVLIFVHELGHFIMAKKFGVHVYEFAIGMGPVVVSF